VRLGLKPLARPFWSGAIHDAFSPTWSSRWWGKKRNHASRARTISGDALIANFCMRPLQHGDGARSFMHCGA